MATLNPPLMNRLLTAIAPVASAMAAFDTWIGNMDRHNEGNLILTEDVSETPAVLRIAYIDYANSLTYGWPDDAHAAKIAVVGHYPPQAVCDVTVVSEVLARIEALGNNVIEEVISRVPDAFIPDEKRRIIFAALIDRKTRLRSALKTIYPILP